MKFAHAHGPSFLSPADRTISRIYPSISSMAFKTAKTSSMKATSKRVSKIAHGRYAKAVVLRGSKEKTVGGLTKTSLMRNKRGKIVSKKASAQGRKAFVRVKDWVTSVQAARKALQFSGFVPINGKTHQGKALYHVFKD